MVSLSSDGFLRGTPTNDNVGTHNIIVRVTDEAGIFAEKSFNLVVNNVNDPPTLEEVPNASINEDTAFSYQLKASDIDANVVNETLTYTGLNTPSWLTVSSSGLLTGTPTNNDVGTHGVTVKVTDSGGATDTKTFTLTVNNVNDAPVFNFTPPSSTSEDSVFSYQLTANDIDANVVNETLTYTGLNTPSWLTVSSSGLLTGTPTNDDVGTHSVTVQVADSSGATDTRTFSLTVNNVNDAPVFNFTPPSNTNEDVAFSLQLSATDPDALNGAATLTYSEVKLPNWLTLSSDGFLRGTPTNDDVGTHNIIVRVTDEAGIFAEKSFNLTVNNVNDPPTLEEVPNASINEDTAFSYQLKASDIDADVVNETLTYIGLNTPSWLTVSSSGLLTGTPTNNDVGTHGVTVKVTDSGGATDTKTFMLTVNNVNDAPVFNFTPPHQPVRIVYLATSLLRMILMRMWLMKHSLIQV